MQDHIRGLIGRVMTEVLSGADEDEVYQVWREITAEQVASARSRFSQPAAESTTGIDVSAAVRTSLAEARRLGPHEDLDPDTVTDVVLCFDENLASRRRCSSSP